MLESLCIDPSLILAMIVDFVVPTKAAVSRSYSLVAVCIRVGDKRVWHFPIGHLYVLVGFFSQLTTESTDVR